MAKLFVLLYPLAGIALLWPLYLLRIRQIRRQLKGRLNAQLADRERIARELHDTLLQSAQGLILIVQSLAGRLKQADSMRQDVAAALDRADDLLSEARDRAGDLRTVGLDADMAEAIARFGTELFKDNATSLSITTAGLPRVITLAVADDVYRICREALTNAFLHAKATAVTVGIDYDRSEFRLRLRDDGRGIEAVIRETGSKPGHFGLQGMRERALRHGGTLTIGGGDGAGTEVALTIPCAAAYAEEPGSLGWLARLVPSRARKAARVPR